MNHKISVKTWVKFARQEVEKLNEERLRLERERAGGHLDDEDEDDGKKL